jgi:hypothetical protein
MKRLLIIIFLIILAGAARGSGVGAGAISCAKFADQMRAYPQTELTFFFWAQGFMSGTNGMLKPNQQRNLTAISIEEQKRFLREFCDKRPLASYVAAVRALMLTLPRSAPPESN